jgi:RNA polymerase-associated protein
MTLFSGASDIYSHQVRLVVAEKDIAVDIVQVDPADVPDELAEHNPYASVPTLVDRDLSLYQASIIMEYLDERFPHPPLMPVDPVSRARTRLLLHRIEKDLYRNYELVLAGGKTAQNARKELTDDLTAISPFLERSAFFMSEDMSLADCVLAPLLWRLPQLKIDLPKQAQSLLDYGARLFRRESFRRSLTEAERELRTHAP